MLSCASERPFDKKEDDDDDEEIGDLAIYCSGLSYIKTLVGCYVPEKAYNATFKSSEPFHLTILKLTGVLLPKSKVVIYPIIIFSFRQFTITDILTQQITSIPFTIAWAYSQLQIIIPTTNGTAPTVKYLWKLSENAHCGNYRRSSLFI